MLVWSCHWCNGVVRVLLDVALLSKEEDLVHKVSYSMEVVLDVANVCLLFENGYEQILAVAIHVVGCEGLKESCTLRIQVGCFLQGHPTSSVVQTDGTIVDHNCRIKSQHARCQAAVLFERKVVERASQAIIWRCGVFIREKASSWHSDVTSHCAAVRALKSEVIAVARLLTFGQELNRLAVVTEGWCGITAEQQLVGTSVELAGKFEVFHGCGVRVRGTSGKMKRLLDTVDRVFFVREAKRDGGVAVCSLLLQAMNVCSSLSAGNTFSFEKRVTSYSDEERGGKTLYVLCRHLVACYE